jgi:hypothetical protein
MPSKAAVWTGWLIAVLAALLFTFSAVMKVKGGPDVEQGFAHLGLPLTMMLPLAVLELTCLVVYLVPPTAVLGAVLMTGYLGGAICSHWRVGDPFVVHIVLGLALWLSVYLREPRLRALLPVRRG